MAIALVTTHKDVSRRKKHLFVTGTVSGNYSTGGIVVDLTAITNPKLLSNGKASANPQRADVLNSPAGYTAKLTIGATMQTANLKVYSAAGTELAAAAFPAALIAEPFQFELVGPLGSF